MFMLFRSKPEHKPWLVAAFFLLLLAGGVMLTYG
jgi:hypothetical protein